MRGEAILLGNLRGSLAGITASRNASSAFLRERVSPVQPDTIAQLGAKTAFGINAGIYRTLPGASRSGWNNFAKTLYASRKSSNRGQFTGQMAFQSILTSFQNSQRINRSYSLEVNGAVLPSGETFSTFVSVLPNAPSLASAALLQDTNNIGVAILLESASVDAVGKAIIKIGISGGVPANLPNIRNTSDVAVGYAVFLSSANIAENLNYRNKEKYLIGYLDSWNPIAAADTAAVVDYQMTMTDVLNIADYQGFPIANQFCICSVYLVTLSNQMNLIGRKEVQIIGVP